MFCSLLRVRVIVCWSLEHAKGSDGKANQRSVKGVQQLRRLPYHFPVVRQRTLHRLQYPPPAAAFADNEAGGSIRKPGINQVRRCQDLAFLSIISLLAFGFIVDTSFGFNRGDPHRSVRYQSPVLQSIETCAVNFCIFVPSIFCLFGFAEYPCKFTEYPKPCFGFSRFQVSCCLAVSFLVIRVVTRKIPYLWTGCILSRRNDLCTTEERGR